MSEIAIWQPGEAAVPAESSKSQLDDWIMVADKICRLAEVICRSPFVPDGLRGSMPATAAAILTGRELGIPPMTSLANIHVIHGKPGLSALVMRALVMREGHEWVEVEVNNTRVVLKGRRKGEADWATASFSTADATTAKLQLGGYPQDKLYARASARLARRKFSDIIAGMPYSAEELEDGISDEDTDARITEASKPGGGVLLSGEAEGQPLRARAATPRTARRAARTQTAPPAQPNTLSAPAATPPSVADAGGALPPLPGEEEITAPVSGDNAREAQSSKAGSPDPGRPDDTDYDTPKTATTPQITAIWTVLSNVFHFGSDEKEQARVVCGQIIGNPGLESTKDLSKNQAKTILDTLSHWQNQAATQGEHPRDYLIVMLAQAGDAADGEADRGQ